MPRGYPRTGTTPTPRKLGVVTRALLDAGFARDDFTVEQGRVSPKVRVRLQTSRDLDRAYDALAPLFLEVTGLQGSLTLYVLP